MASTCPRCNAARGTGRYCSNCALDFWGDAAGSDSDATNASPQWGPSQVPPPPSGPPAPAAGGGQWTFANLALVAVGVALVIAPFLPFINATAAFVGSLSRSGVEMTDGEALILSVCGGLIAFTGFQRAMGRAVSRLLPIVAAIVAIALSGYYYNQVSDRVSAVASDYALASVGAGLWLAFASAGIAFFLGFRKPDARWV